MESVSVEGVLKTVDTYKAMIIKGLGDAYVGKAQLEKYQEKIQSAVANNKKAHELAMASYEAKDEAGKLALRKQAEAYRQKADADILMAKNYMAGAASEWKHRSGGFAG